MIRFCLYHPNGDFLFQLYLHPLASDTDFWASKACLLSFLLYFRLLLVQQDHRKYIRSFHTFPTVLISVYFPNFRSSRILARISATLSGGKYFRISSHLYTFISCLLYTSPSPRDS